MPLERPVTTIGLVAPLAVKPSGLDVTVYEVMLVPPVDDGAVNATDACVLPAVATTLVGAPGAVKVTGDPPPVPVLTLGLGEGEGKGLGVGVGSGVELGSGRDPTRCEGTRGPAPESFTATARNVYVISGDKPVNNAVPPVPPLIVTHWPPGIAITVIDLIGELPTITGGLNVTAREVGPTTDTPSICGMSGVPSLIGGFCGGSKDTQLR